jgi:hypothetical protein
VIIQDLIGKIAHHERDLDKDVEANGKRKLSESSFSPCEYPHREGTTEQRAIQTLEDDELY